jgi:RNA polymerase sigma-70 factor, ECF subfamily
MSQLDAELVQRFAGGDEEAFGEIVLRHRERVRAVVLSVFGPAHAADADDVAQDVFVHVARVLPRFRGESSLSTWLYRVAFNLAVDRKRLARFRMPHVEHEPAGTSDDDPLTGAIDAQQRLAVQRCVDALPDVYRAVVQMHYWLGRSVEEISENLCLPSGTVKSHLHRARKLLGTCLASKGFP